VSDHGGLLIEEIKTHGVTAWEIDTSHKHPQLRFEWNGSPMMFVFSSTPSDNKAHLNALATLRRMMGVRRIIKKSTSPPKRRARTILLSKMSEFTVKPNPLNALAPAAEIARQRVRDAFGAGRFAFHTGQCGVPPSGCAHHLGDAFMRGWWDAHRRGIA
jgi:hypothetical protein